MVKKPSGVPIDGKRLRRYREKAGLSQEALGERIGVTQETIARYESGERQPGYSATQLIVDILGLRDITQLLPPSAEELEQEKREDFLQFVKERNYTPEQIKEILESWERDQFEG